MYTKDVNAQSPLRILEESIHGGLGRGNLGVIMARAGVGRTSCLVQIALDDLVRGRKVIHLALGQSVDHVHAHYDALVEDFVAFAEADDRDQVKAAVAKNRIIQSYADGQLGIERLEQTIALYEKHLAFKPDAILIDGFEWESDRALVGQSIAAFKAVAKRLDAELWMSAQTHREITGPHPMALTAPCDVHTAHIDVAIFLEPHGDHIWVRLLKDHDDTTARDTRLRLRPDTLRLVTDEEDERPAPSFPPSAYTVLSGAAIGAEAEFGACAERWGVQEVNFSFAGRGEVARTRGLVQLTDSELEQGAVNDAYLIAHMHRSYPNTPLFRKVLQSIWHQVNTAGEVFVVGLIQPDQTVKGGTGWAAELGRRIEKSVYCFDQERRAWFAWRDGAWAEVETPKITRLRFAGTGTRFLSDAGRTAIRELFEKSFGPAPQA